MVYGVCIYVYTYIYYDIHIQIMRKVRVQNQLLTGGHLVPYVQWSSYMVNICKYGMVIHPIMGIQTLCVPSGKPT
jgi:hypothetical protein